nr:MAG TPA: hypothetical protein [Caudoviricetes sp.]
MGRFEGFGCLSRGNSARKDTHISLLFSRFFPLSKFSQKYGVYSPLQ